MSCYIGGIALHGYMDRCLASSMRSLNYNIGVIFQGHADFDEIVS